MPKVMTGPATVNILAAHAGDEALGFEIQSRGGDGVGKAGDGHQGSGAAEAGQFVVKVQPRQQGRQGHQRTGGRRAGVILRKAQGGQPF